MACNLQAIAKNRRVNSSVINITRMYESRPQSVALGIIQRDGSVSWRSLPFLFQHDSCLVPGVRENNRLNTSQGLQVHPGRRCCVDPAIACRNLNTGLRIMSAVPSLPFQECRPLAPAHPKRAVPSLPISALDDARRWAVVTQPPWIHQRSSVPLSRPCRRTPGCVHARRLGVDPNSSPRWSRRTPRPVCRCGPGR